MKIVFSVLLLFIGFDCFSQISSKSGQVRFKLFEVFIKGDTLSFETAFFNESKLKYTPLYIQFFVRDRHVIARTAVQEEEIRPLIPTPIIAISANSSTDYIFLFKQFTIPKTKEFVILVKEKNGSRNLALQIRGKKLLRMIKLKL